MRSKSKIEYASVMSRLIGMCDAREGNCVSVMSQCDEKVKLILRVSCHSLSQCVMSSIDNVVSVMSHLMWMCDDISICSIKLNSIV